MHRLLRTLLVLFAAAVFSAAAALPSRAQGEYDRFHEEFARLKTDTSLSFIWASDLHYCGRTALYNFGITLKGVRVLGEETAAAKADFLALTGDLIHGKNTPQNLLADYQDIYSTLDDYNIKVLQLIGNHDNGSYYASLKKNAEVLDYSEIMDRTWYYKDFKKSRIRVICLNSSDVPVIPMRRGLQYYSIHDYSYSTKQLKWLIKALKVPEDWGCVILTHIDTMYKDSIHSAVLKNALDLMKYNLLNYYYLGNDNLMWITESLKAPKSWGCIIISQIDTLQSNVSGFDTLNDILQCYKDGILFKNEAMNIKADFSVYPSHELIGIFAGHIHKDRIKIIDNTPHIIIGRAFGSRPKFKGVTIDRAQRQIYLTDRQGITKSLHYQ